MPWAARRIGIGVAVLAQHRARHDRGLLHQLGIGLLDERRPGGVAARKFEGRMIAGLLEAALHHRQFIVDGDEIRLTVDRELDRIGSVAVRLDHRFDLRRILLRRLAERREEVAVADIALAHILIGGPLAPNSGRFVA
jgi:hypothetical protein